MCRAYKKLFNDYSRLDSSSDFLAELSRLTGIPVDLLIATIKTGPNASRGTWVQRRTSLCFMERGAWLRIATGQLQAERARRWQVDPTLPP
jgi:hypothetical protein